MCGGMFFPLGQEHKAENFEVLVADDPNLLKWVQAAGEVRNLNFVQEWIFSGALRLRRFGFGFQHNILLSDRLCR